MSFAVRPSTDLVVVEAGANVPLSLEVANRGEEVDRFELEVEGLDPEWLAIPVPSFPVEAGETHVERVFFKPPRTSESLAGNYPFVLKVRSLTSGEQRTAQGVLQIRPFSHVSMELTPKRGFVSPFRKQNSFGITMMNLGNAEHQLQFVGSDPEDECAFDFEHDQISLSPGQQKEVEVVVTPKVSSFISPSRLFGFSVHARSTESSGAVASSQAQLEQRAFLSPSTLVFLVFVTMLLGAWLYMMPKPPTIEMAVSPEVVSKGEQVKGWYRASHASQVQIMVGDEKIVDSNTTASEFTYFPRTGGELVFKAVALRGDKRSGVKEAKVSVLVPEPAPDPEIVSLKASPTQVPVGRNVLLTYKFNDAVVEAKLYPQNIPLEVKSEQIEVPVTKAGEQTFNIIAKNIDGKQVRQSVEITGLDVSQARIIVFRASPTTVEYLGGTVSIDWHVEDAIRVELKEEDSRGARTETVELKGPTSRYVGETTTYTLTAYDRAGKTVEKTVKVSMKDPPQIPPSESFVPSGP